MKNKLPLVYIPEIIPLLSSSSPMCEKFHNTDNVFVLDWDKKLKGYKKYIIKDILVIIDEFLAQFKGQQFNLVIESFSSLIFHQIYKKYKYSIYKTIILNPFDQYLFFHNFNIKQKLLGGTVHDSVYKYMYLFKTLNSFRENPKWIKAVSDERMLLTHTMSFYHKILDQLLNLKNIKEYFIWVRTIDNALFVIGAENPLVNLKLVQHMIRSLKTIPECGFCLQWEKTDVLLGIINDFLKK